MTWTHADGTWPPPIIQARFFDHVLFGRFHNPKGYVPLLGLCCQGTVGHGLIKVGLDPVTTPSTRTVRGSWTKEAAGTKSSGPWTSNFRSPGGGVNTNCHLVTKDAGLTPLVGNPVRNVYQACRALLYRSNESPNLLTFLVFIKDGY